MRTRLLTALFGILAFPMIVSLLADSKLPHSIPYNTVALAGHAITGGGACSCGCPSCVCDPTEPLVECTQGHPVSSNETGEGRNRTDIPTNAPASGLDFGAAAMLIALAFLAWARFRT